MTDWPAWWQWDLELTPHVMKRMVDRSFTEADLRAMLDSATGYAENHEVGRFAIATRHAGRPWEVIVEPDPAEKTMVVVTAYPLN